MTWFLTFGADLADLLHVVLGAVVDGVRDSALADGLVLAGRRRAEHGHVLHRLAQLSGGDAHPTCGEEGAERRCEPVKKTCQENSEKDRTRRREASEEPGGQSSHSGAQGIPPPASISYGR